MSEGHRGDNEEPNKENVTEAWQSLLATVWRGSVLIAIKMAKRSGLKKYR